MAKQFFKLKRLLLDYASHCIVLFVIVLYLFSKVAIAQPPTTNFSSKLENLALLQVNQTPPNSITQTSTVEPSKKPPTSSLFAESGDRPEPNVLISEVVVTGVEGELQNRVYETIQTKPGRISTHSSLKKDINAIFAIGYFSSVKAVPEDTPLGVRVTFKVQLNPILKSVNINSKIPPNRIIDEAFQSQYGSILNWSQLREGIKKIKEWYLDNGYILVQFLDAPKVADDGTVTLEVTEGIIEDVQAQFVKIINGKSFNIQNGEPIQGKTPKALIIDDFGLKPGNIFNVDQVRKELRRIKYLRDFNNVTVSLNPARDYKKVVIQINVEEKDVLTRLNDNLQFENLQSTISPEESPISSQKKILADYQEKIKIARAKNDLRTEIDALYNIGNTYRGLGEYSKAIDFYNQTIRLVRSNKKDSEILNSGTQKCETFTRGTETINYCPQQEIEPREKYLIEINILLNLSDTYRSLGEYQQALTLNHQGLSLIKTIEVQSKDNSNEGNLVLLKAITTLYKSLIYFDLGEKQIAQNCVNEAQNIMNNLLKEFWEEENSESEEDYVSQKVSSLFSTSSLFSRFLTLIVNPDDKQLLTSLVDQWWQILQTIEKPQFDDSPAQFQQI